MNPLCPEAISTDWQPQKANPVPTSPITYVILGYVTFHVII